MDAVSGPVYQSDTDKLKAEVKRLRRLLHEAQTEIARLEPLVDLDPLLPVFNRRAFARELGRVVSYCERYDATAVLLYLDLDGFKSINDRFGHAAGDAVLKHVAQLLIANTRKSDILGRLGGDEFGVLLIRTDVAGGNLVADRIAGALANTAISFGSVLIPVTFSAGLAVVDGSQGADEVIAAADEAMYNWRRRAAAARTSG